MQPCGKGRFSLKITKTSNRPKEYFLSEIVGHRFMANHLKDHRVDSWKMTVYELLDGIGFPQSLIGGYQFFVGAEYRAPWGFYARLEFEGKDEFFFSDSRRFSDRPQDLISEPYELWNAALGYERERWDIRVWGRNLTDEDYAIRGFYFPNDPRDGYTERGWFQLGDPRRYGVTVNLKF